MPARRLRVRARWLLDGREKAPIENGEVVVDGDRITSVGRSQPTASDGDRIMDFPQGTILPGLVDVHAHFTFGTGDRKYEEIMATDSDDLMVERGQRNLGAHVRAGVTTARDSGARNDTAFRLRAIARVDGVAAPRLLVSGPPLTTSRGHFWFCNGEADGAEGVRRQVRRLVEQGADFIKIMASGGETVGTDPRRASYPTDVLAAATDQAHQVGKLVTAHCLSADSVVAALDAGVDQLEHINFLQPDDSRSMDQAVAERIVEQGIYVSPTIQTGDRRTRLLKSIASPTEAERRELMALEYKLSTKLDFVRRLHGLGARIVSGSDAIPSFGDYAIGLELLVQAGLSPMEAIAAATSLAAEAIGVDDSAGALAEGRTADLLVVDGNPLTDIRATGKVLLVLRAGKAVALA